MRIEAFQYTKQKDGKTKDYLIVVLEKDAFYLEGLDLSKLDTTEIPKIVHLIANHEKRMFHLKSLALKEKKEFSEMIEEPEYKTEIEEYKSEMKPYVQKAYRKFLTSNIHEYTSLSDNQE